MINRKSIGLPKLCKLCKLRIGGFLDKYQVGVGQLVVPPTYSFAQNVNQPETPPHPRNSDWSYSFHIPKTESVPNHTLPQFQGKKQITSIAFRECNRDGRIRQGILALLNLRHAKRLIIAWSLVRIHPGPPSCKNHSLSPHFGGFWFNATSI